MTINDIMMRDMAEGDRRQRREDAMRKYDREVRRRLWCRRLRAAGEAVAGVLVLAAFALLARLARPRTPR